MYESVSSTSSCSTSRSESAVWSRGHQLAMPVVAVDPAALVQVDEPAHDRAVVAGVHGETLAAVVERGAEQAELAHDLAAVLLEPALRVLVEALAAEVALRLPLLGQLAADGGPGRDAAVVVAGLEERVEAPHPVVADERILERKLEAVADRQRARDVRRRVHDDERLAARLRDRPRTGLLLPRSAASAPRRPSGRTGAPSLDVKERGCRSRQRPTA